MAVTSVDWSIINGQSLLASCSDDQVSKSLSMSPTIIIKFTKHPNKMHTDYRIARNIDMECFDNLHSNRQINIHQYEFFR